MFMKKLTRKEVNNFLRASNFSWINEDEKYRLECEQKCYSA